MQALTKARDQPGQQGKAIRQPGLAVTVQPRPDVIGCHPHILAVCGEQLFSQLAGQRGIGTRELIDLFTHLLEVVIVTGVFTGMLIGCHRLQPTFPERNLLSGLL